MKKDAIIPFLIAAMFVIAMSAVLIKNYNGDSPGSKSGDLALEFTTDGEAAFEQAKEQGKMVMIDFYAEWCGPCKQMEREAFNDESVAELLQDVIVVRVDIEDTSTNGRLIKKFGSSPIPLVVFFDSDGDEIGRTVGYGGVSAFKREVSKILGKA